MRLRDLPVWPPVWTRKDAVLEKTAIDSYLRGDMGALVDAVADVAASAIVLTMEHGGHVWVGLLPFEASAERLAAVALLFREASGRSIRELATLPLPD